MCDLAVITAIHRSHVSLSAEMDEASFVAVVDSTTFREPVLVEHVAHSWCSLVSVIRNYLAILWSKVLRTWSV